MRPTLLAALLSLSLLLGQTAFAKKPDGSKLDVLPKLSEEGHKRLRKNVEAIDKNIELLKENLGTISTNLEVIAKETEALDKLAAENKTLINNYEEYIAKARSEDVKNRQAIGRLETWRRQLLAARKQTKIIGEEKVKLDQAADEIDNRKLWERDAGTKTQRARNLLQELTNNQAKINAKKNALTVEARLWKARSKNYKNTLRELEQNRSSYSKILARSRFY